ncbi:MAG: hypothetical protein AAGI10_04525 [Pseudomonadota bacterium]
MIENPVNDALQNLRQRLRGCEIAALVDMHSATCLVASSEISLGQERFDALCAEARLLLGEDGRGTDRLAVSVGPLGISIFLRDQTNEAEALCLVLAPDAPMDEVDRKCRGFFGALLPGQTSGRATNGADHG